MKHNNDLLLSGANFPKEFRDTAFGKPDKPFVVVLMLVMVVICGLTLIMALREPPAMSEKHIVKIQNRYAKLVLDAFEIEKRKKKKEKIKPVPPKVVKTIEPPKPKKEEPRVEEIKIEIPKVVERKVKKYDIRKEKVEIAEMEKEVKIETLPELPDVLDKKSSKYGSKKDENNIGLDADFDSGINLANQAPDIDVSRSSRYGGGGRRNNRNIDYMDDEASTLQTNEPQIDTRTIKRYKSKTGSRSGSGSAPIVEDEGEKRVLLARRTPDTKVVVSNKYGGGGYKKSTSSARSGSSIGMEKENLLKKKGTNVSLPETANIQNLEACVDPNEEKRLKKKIVTYVGDASTCSDRWGTYAYLGTEMFSTLEIRFVSRVKKKYNRCEALNRALQCLINKH